jgi:UDP-2,3-diacylglucosamine pyrophosphatase LpxH
MDPLQLSFVKLQPRLARKRVALHLALRSKRVRSMPLTASDRVVVLSDVHLGIERDARLADAVCGCVQAQAGAEVIFNGDTFEFSSVVDSDASRMWRQLCEVHPDVISTLRRHVASGGKLTFVAGNHDAALTAVAPEVVADLGGPERVQVAPWFVRRHEVHIEHGHLWDPDNAPLHPLEDWSSSTEPIGVALMRRFVARRGARAFAHAHETTPAAALQRAARLFGWRMPLLLAQYFKTAGALCFEAAKRRGQIESAYRVGSERLTALASAEGVDPNALWSVLAGAPDPTHLRFRAIFMRLYFDRVLASVAATVGAGTAAIVGAAPLALGVLGLSSAYLASAALQPRSKSRSTGPVQALREASEFVRSALDAELVVFGHTHVAERRPGYVNLGSFGYATEQGRPFLAVRWQDGQADVQQQIWPPTPAETASGRA